MKQIILQIELKQDMGESIFHIGLNGETSSGLYNSPLQNAAYFLSDNPANCNWWHSYCTFRWHC